MGSKNDLLPISISKHCNASSASIINFFLFLITWQVSRAEVNLQKNGG